VVSFDDYIRLVRNDVSAVALSQFPESFKGLDGLDEDGPPYRQRLRKLLVETGIGRRLAKARQTLASATLSYEPDPPASLCYHDGRPWLCTATNGLGGSKLAMALIAPKYDTLSDDDDDVMSAGAMSRFSCFRETGGDLQCGFKLDHFTNVQLESIERDPKSFRVEWRWKGAPRRERAWWIDAGPVQFVKRQGRVWVPAGLEMRVHVGEDVVVLK
jgi:hypothetical protein